MLRRLNAEQPDNFAFTPANLAWAEAQITKFPEGRQASAVIPLLWRAQEQEGWLSRPAIEEVGRMLDMAYIRVLEVATFYFMFQLAPVGSVAHVQICGTTSCMICGAEDLVAVCRDRIAKQPHHLSADGKFSWEEVECLGACANAPMAQIGKDYYEDLTAEKLAALLDDMAAGKVPTPGPQNGRYAAEPSSGLTSLTAHADGRAPHNASAGLAIALGDTLKRIDGSEVPLVTPWRRDAPPDVPVDATGARGRGPKPAAQIPADQTGVTKQEAPEINAARPVGGAVVSSADDLPASLSAASRAAAAIAPDDAVRPAGLGQARDGVADDLTKIEGVASSTVAMLNDLGVYHLDQIAAWSASEIAWVDQTLKGANCRVIRDDWVAQAAILATGQETDFSKRARN